VRPNRGALAALEQDCATALHDAEVARQVAAEVREAHARLENEARAFRSWLAEGQDRVAIVEAELASSTEAARRERQAAEKAQAERDAEWREERAGLEAACRRAHERSAELEAALARQQVELAACERRDATLRAELEAARTRAHADPEQALAKAELEAEWREERAVLEAACRQAQERSAELESALTRHQDELAAWERRDATLRAEVEAARIRAHDDPEQALANAELDRLRAAVAEAETLLEATRSELTLATDRIATLSKTHDEIMADRSRLAADLAVAEERAADLERRVDGLTEPPPRTSRPIPF
jgi:predicted  nucleic acid-binding Zn-ribbon protein